MYRRSGDGLLTAEDLQGIEWNDGKKADGVDGMSRRSSKQLTSREEVLRALARAYTRGDGVTH